MIIFIKNDFSVFFLKKKNLLTERNVRKYKFNGEDR